MITGLYHFSFPFDRFPVQRFSGAYYNSRGTRLTEGLRMNDWWSFVPFTNY